LRFCAFPWLSLFFPYPLIYVGPLLPPQLTKTRRQTPFNPAHRDSPIKLSHWRSIPLDQASQTGQGQGGRAGLEGQTDDDDPFEPFGRPGLGPNVMSYSQVEYDAWLTGKFMGVVILEPDRQGGRPGRLISVPPTLDRIVGIRRKVDPTRDELPILTAQSVRSPILGRH
jgi:hypothetical protein